MRRLMINGVLSHHGLLYMLPSDVNGLVICMDVCLMDHMVYGALYKEHRVVIPTNGIVASSPWLLITYRCTKQLLLHIAC